MTTHRVTIYGPNLSREAQEKGHMHVHAEGCGHGKQYGPGQRFSGEDDGWTIEVTSRKDIVLAIYSDHLSDNYSPEEYDAHWNEYDDLWVAPCVKDLPTE